MKEARKQYLHYFLPWFIVIAILAVACSALGISRMIKNSGISRTNSEAPTERVYDYADVLTDTEEELLRRKIAKTEEKLHIDIVLVTFSQSVEGVEAMEQYGYRSANWETNMQDIADDFWDENKYGYNKGFEGDGVLLLHNWYEGQNGEHLSTSGRVEHAFSVEDIDEVLYAVDRFYDIDPYMAYDAYIDEVSSLLGHGQGFLPWFLVLVIPVPVALIYAMVHLTQKKAENTTRVNAYVVGGKPQLHGKTDDFIRKSVVTRHIQTSSGSGGGSRSSGGGGHHISSSGASHGGGSHRH